MRKTALLLVFFALPAHGTAPDAAAPYLADLHKAAKCDDAASPWRPWCIAADGWAKGKPGTPAPLLVGATIELEKGKSIEDSLQNRVYLSALAFRAEGKKRFAKITTIKPTNDEETQQVGEAVAGLALVLKGKAERFTVDKALKDYLDSLPAKASYEVSATPTGLVWQGASAAELRQVGDFWVTVETPAAGNGVFVTVYSDRFGAR